MVDRQLADIVAALDLGRDAIVVTADHGHLPSGGHGGGEREVVEVPLVLAGAGVRPGATPRDAALLDVAPTVAALLGLPAPGHGLGRTLTEVLALEPGLAAVLDARDAVRIVHGRDVVAREQASAAAVERLARPRRVLVVALGGFAIALLLALGHRIGVLRVDRRGVALGLIGLPLVAFAMFATIDGRLTLSCFGNTREWTERLLAASGLITATQVALNLGALRGHGVLLDRLASVNGVAAVALAVATAANGAVWAAWGTLAPAALPGELGLFLLPAVHLVVAPLAIGVGAALAIELIALAARSSEVLPFAHPETRGRRGARELGVVGRIAARRRASA
jgi:hypothetical protein